MFIITLKYIKPLEEVDQYLDKHREYIKQYFANGVFIMGGRKQPRDGGIIIANGNDKVAIEKIAKEDPFYQNGVSEFTLTEFLAQVVELKNFKG